MTLSSPASAGAPKPAVMITGSSGLIGAQLADKLSEEFRVVGLDVQPPKESSPNYRWEECDMTDDQSVGKALKAAAEHIGGPASGRPLASVIHLAAYYDFSGEPSPLYKDLTVEGTRRLLKALKQFQVEQFMFSSTLLAQKPAEEGEEVSESSPLQAEWDYPQSKVEAEQVIAQERGDIPAVILRIAGVYHEDCGSIPIAQQITRIYQKQLESYLFPGDLSHGQAFIHLDDLIECMQKTVKMRSSLGPHEVFVIGEDDVMSYAELQDEIGELIHGREWPTIRIPKTAAKAGAWAKEKLARGQEDAPFIKPWMIDLADQNYPVNIEKARQKLQWQPTHTLRGTLPEMIRRLKEDPRGWHERNKLPVPDATQTSCVPEEPQDAGARQ